MTRAASLQLAALFLATAVMSGCSNYSPSSSDQLQPTNFPSGDYLKADPNHVYKINSELSQIIVTVRRGGLMARLGHDHIVASNHVQGFIYLDRENQQCKADIFVPLNALEVDNIELRAASAMTTEPSAADIAGTKSNMLKSIEAIAYPFALLQSSDCTGSLSSRPVSAELNIHGVTQAVQLAVAAKQPALGQLALSGEFSLLQSDFGIKPFSIMNGLIKVQDELVLTFRLQAQKPN